MSATSVVSDPGKDFYKCEPTAVRLAQTIIS